MQNQNQKINHARIATASVLALCFVGLTVLAATPVAEAATCRVYQGGQILLECATEDRGICGAGSFEGGGYRGNGCFAVDYTN